MLRRSAQSLLPRLLQGNSSAIPSTVTALNHIPRLSNDEEGSNEPSRAKSMPPTVFRSFATSALHGQSRYSLGAHPRSLGENNRGFSSSTPNAQQAGTSDAKKGIAAVMSNPKTYLYAVLAFAVASSKHIIIYNEETLVALTFFLFVGGVYKYAGDTIGASLDERAQAIYDAAMQSFQAREAEINTLSGELRKSLTAPAAIKQLHEAALSNFSSMYENMHKAMEADLVSKVEKRLGRLAMLSRQAPVWTNILSNNLLSSVLLKQASQSAEEEDANSARLAVQALRGAKLDI
jgi:hypothetical protein